MASGRISIRRERGGFQVSCTDPKISAANAKKDADWTDPDQDFQFKTKEEVLKFIEGAIDISLPDDGDEYSTAFDKLAKDAKENDDG